MLSKDVVMTTLVTRVFQASFAARTRPPTDMRFRDTARDLSGATREVAKKAVRSVSPRYRRREATKIRVKRNRRYGPGTWVTDRTHYMGNTLSWAWRKTMPWKEVNSMDERIKFVARYLGDECTMTELCRAFGISRKSGYKWIERYQAGGVSGLVERSRTPHSHPNALSPAIKRLILEARARRPNWGPRKLKVVLERRHPGADIPAASTIGRVLKSEGLIKPKARRRRRSAPHGVPLVEYSHPNAVWCADFKGHFPIAGNRCLPLTITDGYSRKILTCKAMTSSVTAPVMKVFERAFREFGLPEVIRTDNGAPFSSLAPAGLSQLAVWWIKLN